MKKVIKIVVFIIILGFIATAIFFVINKLQKQKIELLESKIGDLKEESIPIRFKILDYDDNYINVAIKLYDADNNEIIRKELHLEGDQLAFDFLVLPINDKFIAFPYKIYTNKIAPDLAETIFSYYDINGFPQIFYYKNINYQLTESLTDIFDKIKTGDTDKLENIFGSMVQDVKKENMFKERQIYKIVIRTKGGIEILED